MKSFEIEIPDAVLEDLRERLARTRLIEPLPGEPWSRGTDRAYLEELCRYWREEFDWRAQERALNRFDHFRTEIDGQGLHFLHALSSGMIHGVGRDAERIARAAAAMADRKAA